MARSQKDVRIVACRCGQVRLAATGRPIVSGSCHCSSCQEAGRRLEQLAGAPRLVHPDDGTRVILYPKDRVRCERGEERLREYRLAPESPTRRIVAACCNSAMFLDFTGGHWLTLYAERLGPADRPPVEMRAHSGRFLWRLLSSWAAMGFRSPRIDWVKGGVNV